MERTMGLPKIDVPLYTVKVPSTNKKINIRPLTVKEEKILLLAQQSEDIKQILLAVKQVINNCIQETNFDINSLAVFDIEYLFLQLRAKSINNIASVSYKDNDDGKIYSFDIDLDKIDVTIPKKQEFKIKLVDGKIIELKYPTISLFDNLVEGADEQQQFDAVTLSILDKLYDGDEVYEFGVHSPSEVKDFIDSFDVKTFDKIKEFIDNIPSISHTLHYTDAHGNKKEILLKGVNDFFI
jgi:hypothetical protein